MTEHHEKSKHAQRSFVAKVDLKALSVIRVVDRGEAKDDRAP